MKSVNEAAAANKAGGVVSVAQLADNNANLGGGGVDKLVAADVQAHMGGGLFGIPFLEDHQIAWLKLTHRDSSAVLQLAGTGTVQAVAKLLIHISGQAGAVKALGGSSAMDIAAAHKLEGVIGDFLSLEGGGIHLSGVYLLHSPR